MPPNMQKRISLEIQEVINDKSAPLNVCLKHDGNLFNLYGSITGPPKTPYEGGIFLLDITLHFNHPFSPPNIKFITKVYHPNVSSATGAICLDVLKENWSPAMTLRVVLMSIQALLAAPNGSSPQDFEVAKVFTAQTKDFNREARIWTEHYAITPLEVFCDTADQQFQ